MSLCLFAGMALRRPPVHPAGIASLRYTPFFMMSSITSSCFLSMGYASGCSIQSAAVFMMTITVMGNSEAICSTVTG